MDNKPVNIEDVPKPPAGEEIAKLRLPITSESKDQMKELIKKAKGIVDRTCLYVHPAVQIELHNVIVIWRMKAGPPIKVRFADTGKYYVEADGFQLSSGVWDGR